jgi:hexokinase
MAVLEHALNELASCLTVHSLLDLARRFSETYQDLAKSSTEHFLTTPVTALPTGKEHGRFLAIDVGGSNLRVGIVELTGQHTTIEDGEIQTDDPNSTRIRRCHDKSWPIGDHSSAGLATAWLRSSEKPLKAARFRRSMMYSLE